MDASQYKDYVLTLLFMKYVSDKYAGSNDFADITVPPGGSFADMVAALPQRAVEVGFSEGHGGGRVGSIGGWRYLRRMTITGGWTERQPARSRPDGAAKPRAGCGPYRGHRVDDRLG